MATVAGAEREDDGQAAKIAATFSSAASLILSFSASLQPLQLQQQPLCLSAAAAIPVTRVSNVYSWNKCTGDVDLGLIPVVTTMAAAAHQQGGLWAAAPLLWVAPPPSLPPLPAYLLPLYTFPPFRPNMAAGQLRQGNIWALYRETIPKFYEIHSWESARIPEYAMKTTSGNLQITEE